MAPNMSIWPNVEDDSVELKIKLTREWIINATPEQKIEAMFFFADAWGAAIGLKS